MYLIGLHWCTKCNEYKPGDKFTKNSRAIYKKSLHCKQCKRKSDNARGGKYQVKHYRSLKSYYKKVFGGRCAICKYDKTQHALDFHHVEPENKKNTPSAIINSNNHEEIMKELDKCILLCRNCHSELGSNCWSASFYKKKIGWGIKENSVVEYVDNFWEPVQENFLYSQSKLDFAIPPKQKSRPNPRGGPHSGP